jgi:anthranilate phosphoribosyltransferase
MNPPEKTPPEKIPPGKLRRQEGFGERGDDFYEALLAAHDGLDANESAALNARLVLLLANHVGNLAVLREALALARASVKTREPAAAPASGSKDRNART